MTLCAYKLDSIEGTPNQHPPVSNPHSTKTMSNIDTALTSDDKTAHAPIEAPTNGLGNLGKLPRELRDIVYEAMLATTSQRHYMIFSNIPRKNPNVEYQFSRPYCYGPSSIFQVSSAIRNDSISVALGKSHVIVEGYRNIHRLTTFLSANNAFGSVRSLELGGMNNIRTLLSHIDKFPALQRLGIGMCTSVLARVEYRVNEPTADSVAKIVQKYRLEKLLECSTLRYLTLHEFSSNVCICRYQSNERALRGLGLWLTRECEERKIGIHVGLLQICKWERNGRLRWHETTIKRLSE